MTGVVCRDLEALRDHARAMASMSAPNIIRRPEWYETPEGHPAVRTVEILETPLPTCSERALWTQIADEIDAYLASDTDEDQEALL